MHRLQYAEFTFDADIFDDKRFKSGCTRNEKRSNHTRQQVLLHKFSRKSIKLISL